MFGLLLGLTAALPGGRGGGEGISDAARVAAQREAAKLGL